MLEVSGLSFSYRNGVPVLDSVSFEAARGRLCALFGPNGSGKTTLFKCIMRFVSYRAGSIAVDGKDVRSLTVRELARTVAYVPQEHKASFPFPAGEVVLMGRGPHTISPFGASKSDKRRAAEALDAVGISDLGTVPYNELSGGQRQLVMIARAMAQEPGIMLLDEPTSALDFSNQVMVWSTLREIVSSGTTVMACTHDPNHVSWFCDDVIVLGNSGFFATGTPMEVLSEEILGVLYGGTCKVETAGGFPVVLPAHLGNRRAG